MDIRQTPAPDAHLIRHRGDIVTFVLELEDRAAGKAFIRTNLGRGHIRNEEIIRYAEQGLPPLSQDWHDLPMSPLGTGRFTVTLPLLEVGRFEAKAFFMSNRQSGILWPPGGNTILKVEPAETVSCNTMYTAFVRQFGPEKENAVSQAAHAAAVEELDDAGYAVIPRSGKFRDLIRELDFITQTLRCRIVQLLPIFPTPTTYARMGRFGSPFAAMNLFDVDPALAEFDKQTTPLQQFQELADEVHRRDARLFLDLPINHTGWASSLQIHHPEWFVRNDDDSFMSPGAWGIVWGDLSELDYSHRDLWKYMARVFLFWCRLGADGFRLDAGYKIPFEVWRYIVARVRNQYPDTVFMLEGLGGDPKVTERLLADSGIDWAYSELFQNYTLDQIDWYYPRANRISKELGTLINFSETHDNNRLAAVSPVFARLRTALCAASSDAGAFGFANGVEWYATEKISVHGNPPLHWGAESNMVGLIGRLHAMMEVHPSFFAGGETQLIHNDASEGMVLLRRDAEGGNPLIVLANLDHEHSRTLSWPRTLSGAPVDLLTGRKVPLKKNAVQEAVLAPGEVLVLSDDKKMLAAVAHAAETTPLFERNRRQMVQAKALEVCRAAQSGGDVLDRDFNSTEAMRRLLSDPVRYVEECTADSVPRVTLWHWPADARRTVMIPPAHFLHVSAPHPFTAVLRRPGEALRFERSLMDANGRSFVLMTPCRVPEAHESLKLILTVFDPAGVRHVEAPLLLLSEAEDAHVECTVSIRGEDNADRSAVAANEIGALAQVRRGWGEVKSKYDALLSGNLNPCCPSDRRIMLSRIRAWIVCRGYSFPLDLDSQKRFSLAEDGALLWRFSVPGGQGLLLAVKIVLRMDPKRNRITVDLHRLPEDGRPHRRSDNVLTEIILRPDIEDRISHEVTKAYAGPERVWPDLVTAYEDGFTFSPGPNRRLHVFASKGTYTDEKEWKYQVGYPEDAERGMDDSGDLFSPGYFRIPLFGGRSARISAEISTQFERPDPPAEPEVIPNKSDLRLTVPQAAVRASAEFIVNRDEFKTVLAGYPWFLDWGRDTLIALRGIIAAGMTEEARAILLQFAKFERGGTLPNMIRGGDDSNRDTSDAPLFFFTAVSDLAAADGNLRFLAADVGGRTVREVMLSIVRNYIQGTQNGIVMDPKSGLVFSPSHFTWMDTNYPAATPREGYPVEIQALWVYALELAAKLDPRGGFAAKAKKARQSLRRLFVVEQPGERYLADCLRAEPGASAERGVQDDALRPNQLLAVTLGAVTDKSLCRSILLACQELLVPGGIRSLADRDVRCELPIRWNGELLNRPDHPYIGRYTGDEDTRRKPAYHNGTAWTWLFPSFCEAEVLVYGDAARRTSLSLLSSAAVPMNEGCLLHVTEIMDGDAPHTSKGCAAQAWGATEIYRVWKKIEG